MKRAWILRVSEVEYELHSDRPHCGFDELLGRVVADQETYIGHLECEGLIGLQVGEAAPASAGFTLLGKPQRVFAELAAAVVA